MNTYQQFIDSMVDVAKRCVTADRIRQHGDAERTNSLDSPLSAEEQARKDFVQSLTKSQRQSLAAMFEQEREGAVHDVLARLEWHASGDNFQFGDTGVKFADCSEISFQGDFIARMEGDAW